MSEVADLAGVSKPTVSRVLSGAVNVAEDKRSRVMAAVSELGYRPDRLASALRSGRTDDVAVVVPFVTNPSAVERLRGIVDGLRGTGQTLTLFDIETPDDIDSQFDALLARRPGAVIVISISLSQDQVGVLRDLGAMLLVIEAPAHDRDVASVNVDDVSAGQVATEHLLELGHRRIAFVGDTEKSRFGFVGSTRRRLGFVAAHQSAGVDVDGALIAEVPHGRDAARGAALALLGADDPPTAFFAASDTQALGILDAASELGLGVPDDVSVVGCDDVRSSADLGLTTVNVGLYESGQVAAEIIGRVNRAPEAAASQMMLPIALHRRATTSSPKR